MKTNEGKAEDEKERHALLGDGDGDDEDDGGGGFSRNARSNDRSQLSTMKNRKTVPRPRCAALA